MALLTFADRLQILRQRNKPADLYNMLGNHAAELEVLIRTVEFWRDCRRYMGDAVDIEEAAQGMVRALDNLTEKSRKESA